MTAFDGPTAQFSLLDSFPTERDTPAHRLTRHRRPLSPRQRTMRVIIGFIVGGIVLALCTEKLYHIWQSLPL